MPENIMPMSNLTITEFSSCRNPNGTIREYTWENLKKRFKYPIGTNETLAEYAAMSNEERTEVKDVGGFVGGECENGKRSKTTLKNRCLVTIDADHATPGSIMKFKSLYNDYDALFFVHTTHTSTKEKPRLRWIFPLSRPVSGDEYRAIAGIVSEWVGADTIDDTTDQPERLMFWPSCSKDADYQFEEGGSIPIDPDELLKGITIPHEQEQSAKLQTVSDDSVEVLDCLPEKKVVEEGERNKTLFYHASSLYGKGIDGEALYQIVSVLNKEYCNPPLPDSEVKTVCKSVSKYHNEPLDCGSGARSVVGRGKKADLYIDTLEDYLQSRGISIRYDLISKEIKIDGLPKEYGKEQALELLPVRLYDELKAMYTCNRDMIADYLKVIADKNQFNPAEDFIRQEEIWDGTDRLPELYSALHIPDTDKLSQILLHKWLCQCVALAMNDSDKPYGAEGMLSLQGPQGIGKTSFVEKLCCYNRNLYKLGQRLDGMDKDTERRCCSAWIVELGEVETSLRRTDIERLKSFITNNRDEYRVPYGHTDCKYARRTSLIATCNSDKFLNDPTGSRRFWTVPVSDIDLDALDRIEMPQLWEQIDEEVHGNRQCFRLTKEEQKMLAERNGDYELPLKGEQEVRDILEDIYSEDKDKNHRIVEREMTVSEFKEDHPSLNRFSATEIGKVLKHLGYEGRHGNHGTLYTLPVKETVSGYRLA